ncbi:GAF domain-containing protein [Roseateles terrae]|uniref:GAF domain-containing protein n=1 Tax=Roseateles terrae TaxID=431060 RepID=A0ABR6GQZ6_9BURK|nr:GAF domain-containing protein [Roseateles terrae]MBB3194543.1 hypothetical protein [Roseateles terrae]OWQ83451.1 hypothetical protein CDN98_22335 [Roseateles terrae]
MNSIESLYAAMRGAAHVLDWEGSAGLRPFACQTSEALARYFSCSHASLWLLDGIPGHYQLRCLGSFEAEDGPSRQPAVCDQQAYPGYFDTLLTDGVFRCEDACTDPRLFGLTPPTWRSMLDMAGQINGRTVGVLALGQRGSPRVWTRREELDLRRATAKTCLRLHGLHMALETV